MAMQWNKAAVNSESGQNSFPVAQLSIFNFAVWSRTGGTSYIYVQGGKENHSNASNLVGGFNPSPVSTASAPFNLAELE